MVEPERGEFITRLTDSVETALRMSEGMVHVDSGDGTEWLLSDRNACPDCNMSFPELNPAMFSFNSPLGMCPECNGLGTKMEFDPARFFDPEKSLNDGGFRPWGELSKKHGSGGYKVAQVILAQFGGTLDTPWKDLPEASKNAMLYGGVRIVWKWENKRSKGQNDTTFEGEFNSSSAATNRPSPNGRASGTWVS